MAVTEAPVHLERDVMGRLLLLGPDGIAAPVRPVRLFPLSCPEGYIVLLDNEDKELALVHDLEDIDATSCQALQEELESAYLVPQILSVYDIQDEFGVLHWHVRSDRGDRHFDLRGRDEIYPLESGRFLLRDIDGNRYEIRNVVALDPRSQVLVDAHL